MWLRLISAFHIIFFIEMDSVDYMVVFGRVVFTIAIIQLSFSSFSVLTYSESLTCLFKSKRQHLVKSMAKKICGP